MKVTLQSRFYIVYTFAKLLDPPSLHHQQIYQPKSTKVTGEEWGSGHNWYSWNVAEEGDMYCIIAGPFSFLGFIYFLYSLVYSRSTLKGQGCNEFICKLGSHVTNNWFSNHCNETRCMCRVATQTTALDDSIQIRLKSNSSPRDPIIGLPTGRGESRESGGGRNWSEHREQRCHLNLPQCSFLSIFYQRK